MDEHDGFHGVRSLCRHPDGIADLSGGVKSRPPVRPRQANPTFWDLARRAAPEVSSIAGARSPAGCPTIGGRPGLPPAQVTDRH